MATIEQLYLDDCLAQFRRLKTQAERATAQVTDDHLFTSPGPETNSIAIIMKHLAGSLRSRWTDFLTTDGEKPNRDRDGEFEPEAGESRETLLAGWEDGWNRLFATLSSLQPEDVRKTVTVRGESQSALEAINKQCVHVGMHVGQIILLARHYAGERWQTLTLPRRKARPTL